MSTSVVAAVTSYAVGSVGIAQVRNPAEVGGAYNWGNLKIKN